MNIDLVAGQNYSYDFLAAPPVSIPVSTKSGSTSLVQSQNDDFPVISSCPQDVISDFCTAPPVPSSLSTCVSKGRRKKSKSMKELLSAVSVKPSLKVKHNRGLKPSLSCAVLSDDVLLKASGLSDDMRADCLNICNPVAIDCPDPEASEVGLTGFNEEGHVFINVENLSEVGMPNDAVLVSSNDIAVAPSCSHANDAVLVSSNDIAVAPSCSHASFEIQQQVTVSDLHSSKRKLPDSFMEKYISVNPAWEEMSKQLVLYGANDSKKGKQGVKSAKRI